MKAHSLRPSRLAGRVAALAACVPFAGVATAGVQEYASRAAWVAAAGPATGGEDFEGFLNDVDFSLGSTSLPNGFSLSHAGGETFRNLIDAPPVTFGESGNGTSAASLFVDADGASPDVVTLTLDDPAFAIGFDLVDLGGGSGEGSVITLLGSPGATATSLALPSDSSRFVGFAATAGDFITGVVFSGRGNGSVGAGEGFFLDNVAFVTIPEPAAATLVVAGLLAELRRRR